MPDNQIDASIEQPPIRIVNGILVVDSGDRSTHYSFSHERLLEMIQENRDLKFKVDDLERDLNWRNPDRFLDEALKKMDEFYFEAMKAGERPRAEAYAASVGIMRGYLGDSAEHERRMKRR